MGKRCYVNYPYPKGIGVSRHSCKSWRADDWPIVLFYISSKRLTLWVMSSAETLLSLT